MLLNVFHNDENVVNQVSKQVFLRIENLENSLNLLMIEQLCLKNRKNIFNLFIRIFYMILLIIHSMEDQEEEYHFEVKFLNLIKPFALMWLHEV